MTDGNAKVGVGVMVGEGVMVGVGVSVGVNVLVGVGVWVSVGVNVGVLVGVGVFVHAAAVAVAAVAVMVACCSAEGPQAAMKVRKRIRKTVRFIRFPREKLRHRIPMRVRCGTNLPNLFELNESYQQCYHIFSQRLDVIPALHHQQRWEVQTGN